MIFNEIGRCVVCGRKSKKPLCLTHIKYFHFVKRCGFYAINPRHKISKPQTILFLNIRKLFKLPCYQEVIFEFNIYRRYDIVIPKLKLIIEYNGEQHEKYIPFFHKNKKRFQEFKQQEIVKESTAKGNGYKVIRFSSIEKIDDINYVVKKLKLKGVCIKKKN